MPTRLHIATVLAGYRADDVDYGEPASISGEARAQVYARSGSHRCYFCHVVFLPCPTVPTPRGTIPGAWRTLDHLLPASLGGTGTADNLVAACFACNHQKASASAAEFLTNPWLHTRRASVARLQPGQAAA